MSAPPDPKREGPSARAPHPNDVDRKRIERSLARRERYRYVSPTVLPAPDGYLITSPCCSRNVDPDGGEIAIARLVFAPERRMWQLLRRDHAAGAWVAYFEYANLAALLAYLNEDPERLFWV